MTIKLLAFGPISDIISQKEMNFPTVKDTDELRAELLKQFPKLAPIKYAMAVNQKVSNQSVVLNENDVVALLPPFSGG